MSDEVVKKGLNENPPIKETEGSLGMNRPGPGQVPPKKPTKSATKAGKKFKIT
jgi:hypothetical protein